MTSYTVAPGGIAKYELSLAAGAEDVIVFAGAAGDRASSRLNKVAVTMLSGTKPIYFCFGTAATVKGDHCWRVDPLEGVVLQTNVTGDGTVHLISEAAATYSVVNGGDRLIWQH